MMQDTLKGQKGEGKRAERAWESPRCSIYYWKCDRPFPYRERSFSEDLRVRLCERLRCIFNDGSLSLEPAGGQGNHCTFIATGADRKYFVRVGNGPESDLNMEVESAVLDRVRAVGVPTPRVFHVEANRMEVPFAFQVLELIPCSDLNTLQHEGSLNLALIAELIGEAIARWQTVEVKGWGPFDPGALQREGRLAGFHRNYADYFSRHLDRHLLVLAKGNFLSPEEVEEISAVVASHRESLALLSGCLVHKDLAFWNIMGTANQIRAFIDWDDAVAGDPMDDFSLLGCFFDGCFLRHALAGYTKLRALSDNFQKAFWLHLIRNLVVKSVIRLETGVFERREGHFLLGGGTSGAQLRIFTKSRLRAAVDGLLHEKEIWSL